MIDQDYLEMSDFLHQLSIDIQQFAPFEDSSVSEKSLKTINKLLILVKKCQNKDIKEQLELL